MEFQASWIEIHVTEYHRIYGGESMVRIKISDLHSNLDEQRLNEITDKEMKTVEGGILREPPNTGDIRDSSSTGSTNTSVRSTLRQVNKLLDNLRFELDKLYSGETM